MRGFSSSCPLTGGPAQDVSSLFSGKLSLFDEAGPPRGPTLRTGAFSFQLSTSTEAGRICEEEEESEAERGGSGRLLVQPRQLVASARDLGSDLEPCTSASALGGGLRV